MNSKARKICLLVVMLVILASILTACQLNDTLEDKLNQYGLSAKITYHANGGFVNDNNALLSADVYYKDGDKAFNVGIGEKKDGTFSVVRENYTLQGWYYPQKNEDGSLKYNERTNLVELGDAFDFSAYVAKAGDAIELYAKWVKNQSIKYVLASESLIDNKLVYTLDDTSITKLAYKELADDEDPTEHEAKYVIKSEDFGIYEYVSERSSDPLSGKANNYSFVGYYSDAECTTPVEWPIYRTGGDEDIVVYAKYLPSEWTVVETVDDFASIFRKQNNNGKYYIKNNIDGSDKVITLLMDTTFSGMIKGNGFTVSGFTFEAGGIKNNSVSIFGEIASGAVIENITLKDFRVNLVANRNAKLTAHFLANDIANDSTITNVVVDGGAMKVNLRSNNSSWKNVPDDKTQCPLYVGGENADIEVVLAPTLNVIE